MTWLKGFGLSAVFLLLPALLVPQVFHDWRLWWLFAGVAFVIGSQPNFAYTKVGRDTASAEDRGSRRLILIAGYISVLGPYLQYLWRFGHPCPLGFRCCMGSTVAVIAAVIGLSALVLRAHSIRVLGRFFTSDVQIVEGHELCRKGPYRWLRHPSYTGSFLFFSSIPFVFGFLFWAVAVIALWSFVYRARIRAEETALAGHFGEAYEAYRKETWALIPWLW